MTAGISRLMAIGEPDHKRDPVPPVSLRQRQRQRTHDALLRAAERRFAVDGYSGTTVEAIAGDAVVSVSSLYNRFGGKPGIYLAVVEQALEANRRYMDQAWDPSLTPLEQVLLAGDAYLLFHLDHPGLFQMVAMPQMGSRPSDVHVQLEERIAARVETEVGRVEAAIRAGVRSKQLLDVDPALAAKFLWSAWNGVVALSMRPDRLRASEDDVRDILDVGRRLALEGLAPPGARMRSGHVDRSVRFLRARRPDGDEKS